MTWGEIAKYSVLYYACGSVLFWLPDALWHSWMPPDIRSIDFIALTFLSPATALVGWKLLMRRASRRIDRMFVSAMMLLGILTTCPLRTMVNATIAGRGFASGLTWRQVGILTILFPLADIGCSTYDGTLFALGICMVGLFVLAVRDQRDRGLEPEQGSPGTLGYGA